MTRKIQVVLRRIYKFYSSSSTGAAAWALLTAVEAGVGLAASEALSVLGGQVSC